MKKIRLTQYPFQPTKDCYVDEDTNYYTYEEGQVILKINDLELSLYKMIRNKVKEFNSKYGTDFQTEASILRYANVKDYPYQKPLKKLNDWITNIWVKAREYQLKVHKQELEFSEEGFFNYLPKLEV